MKIKVHINGEIDKFFDDVSEVLTGEPRIVFIMGPPAAGKTTVRKQCYRVGYIVLDANEIFRNLCDGIVYNYQDFQDVVDLIGGEIAIRAINDMRNIVFEVIGNEQKKIEELESAMRAIGYKTALVFVSCKINECKKRYQIKVDKDPLYIPCHYTENRHIQWLLDALVVRKESRN